MKIEVINDGSPDATNNIKDVKSVSILTRRPVSFTNTVSDEYRYCMVSGWFDQAALGMTHNLFGQVYVHPGCNVIVRTGKGCCLTKHEYRIDSEGDIYSLYNEILFMLAMEKV